MSPRRTLHNVLNKNLDKREAILDLDAFAVLEGDQGDRILEHLFIKFQVFESSRNKNAFQAGYDEGVKAVLVYIENQRSNHNEIKTNLEVKND